jgi:hypothetical protein
MKGEVPLGEEIEDQVDVCRGSSTPEDRGSAKKTSSWQKGLIGQMELRFGPQYDKGHFMARRNGGGSQLNIFPQRRDVNRPWSKEGKLFRDRRPIATSIQRRCALAALFILRSRCARTHTTLVF